MIKSEKLGLSLLIIGMTGLISNQLLGDLLFSGLAVLLGMVGFILFYLSE